MSNPKSESTRASYTDTEIKDLIKVYISKRVDIQMDFYENRKEENLENSNFVFNWSLLFMVIAGVLSTLNATLGPIWWLGLVVALLPVFASLLASFEKVYGWNRQATLYQDAFKRLRENKTIAPPANYTPKQPFIDILIKLVSTTENTLKSEMNQWGQPVLENQSNIGSISSEDALTLALERMDVPDDVKQQVRNMLAAAKPQSESNEKSDKST